MAVSTNSILDSEHAEAESSRCGATEVRVVRSFEEAVNTIAKQFRLAETGGQPIFRAV